MFWLILTFSWAIFFWNLYLAIRQYRTHRNIKKRPENVKEIITEEEYDKARLYSLDKHHFGFCQSIYSQLEMTVLLLLYIPLLVWNKSGDWSNKMGFSGEISQSIIFLSFVSILECITSTPWQLYDTFVIEERHGFNKQTLSFFIKDKLKKTVVSLVIMAPVTAAVIFIVEKGGPYFFFYIWIFLSLIIFLLMTVYPEFIAPLFDKYQPLPDSHLKGCIEELAANVNYPLKKILVVQGSKRSAHSNAYMYGFWKNKRIVLYDTLLSEEFNEKLKKDDPSYNKKEEEKETDEANEKRIGMKDEEVVAVLGHELGHWALWHTVINLVITELNLFLLLAVFARFYNDASLYRAFGFDTKPTIIGLIIVLQYITAPYNELVSFLATVISRRLEFAADAYSEQLGHGDQLCAALIKLGKDNLSLPVDDPLYSMCNHSHPPIPERIEALKKFK